KYTYDGPPRFSLESSHRRDRLPLGFITFSARDRNDSNTRIQAAARNMVSATLDRADVQSSSLELSSRRTGLSFQRTRMSADRTLMSVIRTALSLIGFGFTIFQFFHFLRTSAGAAQVVPLEAGRRFGEVLVFLGVLMLTLGLVGHVSLMRQI